VAGCIGTCDADGAAAAGVGELDAPLSQDGSLARGGEGDLLPAAVPGPPPAPPCLVCVGWEWSCVSAGRMSQWAKGR